MNQRKVILLIFFAIWQYSNAQTPNWNWAKSSAGNGHDYGRGISNDAAGNCYATGTFQPPSAIIGNDTLTASTSFNSGFFIAKYDSAGNAIWAKTNTGVASVHGTGIKTDAAGISYVVGYYRSIGALNFGNYSITSPGNFEQAFIAKYDSAGNALWAQNAGAINWGAPANFSVDIDSYGNAYLTGTFEDSAYLVKFNASGNQLWRKKYFGNITNTFCWSINVDINGNNIVTGYSANTNLIFGALFVPNNSNGYQVFIVKSDSTGSVIWAKNDGNYPSLYKPDISSDSTGNLYLTGYFLGDSTKLGNTTLYNQGADDIFIVKYDPSGNFVWAQRAGGFHFDLGQAIATDKAGYSYITGFFRAAASFGPYTLYSANDPDVFVAKYDPSGNVLWAKKAGGFDVDNGNDISIDAWGNSCITGNYFSDYASFDLITLTNSNLVTFPSEFFIAKLSDVALGIEDLSSSQSFSIFPNPFTNQFTLRFNEYQNSCIIKLYDISGREIRKINFSGYSLAINTDPLSRGLYFLSAITAKGIVNRIITSQ